jgi:hydrogenase expression/formation protein HypC
MCLGVPCQVLSIADRSLMKTGMVDLGGVRREISLDLVPDTQVGDYVIVHAGYALSRLDEEAAVDALSLMREAGLLIESVVDHSVTGVTQLRCQAL